MNKRDFVHFRAEKDTKSALKEYGKRQRWKPAVAARYIIEDKLRAMGLLKRKAD